MGVSEAMVSDLNPLEIFINWSGILLLVSLIRCYKLLKREYKRPHMLARAHSIPRIV